MNPPETHPWVLWAGVIAAVLATVAVIVSKAKEIAAPIAVWLSGLEERKIERQSRIEAASRVLNDQRVSTLSIQLSGVSAQLESVLRQGREDSARYHQEILTVRQQLTETQTQLSDAQLQLAAALLELATLRSELAEYRSSHDNAGGQPA
ncbi:hypothetical protein [Rhodococcus erythropolis]|uniref:hypothetical protein n=1 Tax=Rhodococcus erythropolis TaxID=1833 RepID=UPI001BEC9C35|nr:hypothetical protein [Rhodococcus erythropolis]MBT2266463.1 hypothetical protein [Rhodococcus erythropolis]